MSGKIAFVVEGFGDAEAVPTLAKRVLTDRGLWNAIGLDQLAPIRIGATDKVSGSDKNKKYWLQKLEVAGRRPGVGGILAVFDGDKDKFEQGRFCGVSAARILAARAQQVGAGKTFSLAVVIASMEFESWLIAGIDSLRGKSIPDAAPEFYDPSGDPADTERQPRDAKRWLSDRMSNGYKPTLHQAALTREVDVGAIRNRQPRSFIRFENALHQLVEGCRTGNHVCTPY
jgi:hypothetical protein